MQNSSASGGGAGPPQQWSSTPGNPNERGVYSTAVPSSSSAPGSIIGGKNVSHAPSSVSQSVGAQGIGVKNAGVGGRPVPPSTIRPIAGSAQMHSQINHPQRPNPSAGAMGYNANLASATLQKTNDQASVAHSSQQRSSVAPLPNRPQIPPSPRLNAAPHPPQTYRAAQPTNGIPQSANHGISGSAESVQGSRLIGASGHSHYSQLHGMPSSNAHPMQYRPVSGVLPTKLTTNGDQTQQNAPNIFVPPGAPGMSQQNLINSLSTNQTGTLEPPPKTFGAGSTHAGGTPLSRPSSLAPNFGAASGSMQPGMQSNIGGIPAKQTMPTSGGTSSGGRNIDPGQMPHPPSSVPPVQVFETRRENTHNIPPATDVPIVVRDNGSAGPRYIRCTLNSIPQGADILKASAIPFAVIINPLALPEANDNQINVVDGRSTGPLRCQQCKAYICPFMKWKDGGRIMECCFCGADNEVPTEYFSPLTLENKRSDLNERPELRYGSVEFIVGDAYQVRKPMDPTYLFVIEVTAGAIASGATACVCSSVAKIIPELPGGDKTKVGIITFDSRVHFYSLDKSANNTMNGNSQDDPPKYKMFVMSDVGEPFCALGNRALVNAKDNYRSLISLLESIPKIFSGSQSGESAGGAALHAAVETLKSGWGGKIITLLSSLPHKGTLALRPREAGRPPSERDPLDVMNPEGKGYSKLAVDAAENQICIDIFALSQGYVDLPTLTALCSETSGSAFRYNPFNPSADAARFHSDLRWSLVKPQGLEAVGRLRASKGLSVEKYVGAFHRRNLTDLNFPAVTCDHAIAARLAHEHKLQDGSEAYLQYALLYSSTDGTRRVRIHTLALPVTRSLGTVFRGADLESYLTYMARKVSSQLPGRTLAACKDVVSKSVVDTLTAYRKHCASASSSGQLILPESLKLLPLYVMGLIKLPCFRTDSRADSRAIWASRLLSLSADKIVSTVYPRLIPIHSLLERSSSAPLIPDRLWVTAERLQPEGVYLMENGFDAFVYVGTAAPSEVCTSLFGTTIDSLDARSWYDFKDTGTPLSTAVVKLLGHIRQQRRSFMHLRLIMKGAPNEIAFFSSLVEDRAPSTGMSYVEYLCHLHRQIQNKMS